MSRSNDYVAIPHLAIFLTSKPKIVMPKGKILKKMKWKVLAREKTNEDK